MTTWYIVYTQPSAEAKAAENLERQGFTTYLPRYRKRRRHAGRTETVLRPLFPRYLFVAIDVLQDRWRAVLSTFGVSDLIRHGSQPTPVPEGVVDTLKAREANGVITEPSVADRLKAGDRVELLSGAFEQMICSFHGMDDAERVIVLLDLLGRQVRAVVPADAIAPS